MIDSVVSVNVPSTVFVVCVLLFFWETLKSNQTYHQSCFDVGYARILCDDSALCVCIYVSLLRFLIRNWTL